MAYRTLKEVFAANRDIKNQGFLLRNIRPLGCYMAWLGIRLGIKPTAVSFFTLLLGVAICLSLTLVPDSYRMLVVSLLFVWQILDATDGAMARTLNKKSNYGGFIDYMGGMILLSLLYFGLGIGLFWHPENSFRQLINLTDIKIAYSPVYAVIWGGYCSIAALLIRLLSKVIQVRFGVDINKDEDKSSPLKDIIKELENVGGFQFIIIFLFSLIRSLEILLFMLFLFYILLTIIFVVKVSLSFKNRHDYK